ncbi:MULTISPECIES: NAD(P)H-binding protein [unclassified Actinomyces]|uniref:NAD(P)-dependent oxidoreductase n=1 Tax=unclassified Actinomyces TaxID=2609248 RepID=UPI002017B7D2|nr:MULTISPECIES: NAD(P)H-binding protein [unclassified Actinomyces]MCL3777849.1 NAD(P)H-binding protein [Actinomyces sp. AC-20-1]MCL3790610.1 NAD(P)H-binding protein [Actinomyces sp. 187325]MCL3792863.1 NAD(P)H-binding protein [Actinomyces sp. 186855]MCL3795331.1 NAD(P)H-binding protein [Actinomyces sp. 217892]
MNITVIGGTGTTGSAVVAEAARRGHTVTSVSRSGTRPDGARTAVAADLADTDAVVALVNDADVTVIAVSPDRAGGPTQPTVDAFAALINARPTGRLVVGGAGSLLDEQGQRLVDSPSPAFLEEWRPEALALATVLELLREAGDALAWTFVSPAPMYPVAEATTGRYAVGADTPAGERLSAADLALALVDEAERDAHRGVRFTVASA